MNLSYSEEQLLLKDSVSRFIAKDYDFSRRREVMQLPLGFSSENWALFARLGWLMIPFAEEDGGLGGSAVDLMVLMEEFGKGLVVEPFLATTVLAGSLLASLGSDQQKEMLLSPMIEGKTQLAVCYMESDSRYCLSSVKTEARREGDHFVINGKKSVVLNGTHANSYLVIARTGGGCSDRFGVSCFVVPSGRPGVSVTTYRLNDGHAAADIEFTDVTVPMDSVLGPIDGGFEALEYAVGRATFAACAESVGIMSELLNKTVEYTKTRTQFGVPISSFQALQHRMVDMFIACEQARSMLIMAACEIEADRSGCLKAISAAKARVGQAARLVGQEAVQIHGGIGVTDELDIGHYFKRLTCIENLFGSVDHHVGRYMTI